MSPPARIHLAEPSPPYCAACYQAVPGKRHVDFGSSTDGPVLPSLGDVVGLVGHTIDEVVICETCIAEAAKLIGLEDAAALRGQLDAALESNDALHEQLAGTRANVADALKGVTQQLLTGAPTSPNSNLPIPGHAPKRPSTRRRQKASA